MSKVSQVTVSSPELVLLSNCTDATNTGDYLPLIASSVPQQQLEERNTGPSDSLLKIKDIPAPHSGYIRILELNNPPTRNAISRALLAELSREIEIIRKQFDPSTREQVPFEELRKSNHDNDDDDDDNVYTGQNWPTRAVIIASALDTCFCSGADLKERKTFTPEETNQFLNDLRGTFTALSQLPIPTISAIGSLALGGGLELALSTHFRVVSSNASMGLPETRLGIIPGAGGTYRLSALIGVPQARKLVVTGRRISGMEAYRLGMADQLVDMSSRLQGNRGYAAGMEQSVVDRTVLTDARQAVLDEAVKLAEETCQGGPIAIRAAIQAFQDGPNEGTENALYDQVLKTEDRNEALIAFAEKRRPVFSGR